MSLGRRQRKTTPTWWATDPSGTPRGRTCGRRSPSPIAASGHASKPQTAAREPRGRTPRGEAAGTDLRTGRRRVHWQRRRRVHACALPPAAPSAHGERHTMLSAPCRTRCAGTEGPEAPRQPRKPRGNPSSVVNIYTPDNSSHPTHQQATRRGETPGWRKATCVCLPARAPQRAGGPGAWSRGEVTRRGRGLTRPMEKLIN